MTAKTIVFRNFFPGLPSDHLPGPAGISKDVAAIAATTFPLMVLTLKTFLNT
jgi:hypothetical protein